MRKIPVEIENPIDNFCINIAEVTSPFFKDLNFTPNTITTFSLITGIMSITSYIKGDYTASAFYYFSSYIFDCCDGFYARKYDMVTDFGDRYDHYKDFLVASILLFFIVKRYLAAKGIVRFLPFLYLIFMLTQSVQVGCQERLFNRSGEPNFLNSFKQVCPVGDDDIYDFMKTVRFGGIGTGVIFVVFLILYSHRL